MYPDEYKIDVAQGDLTEETLESIDEHSINTVLANNGYQERIFSSFKIMTQEFSHNLTECFVTKRFETSPLFLPLSKGHNRVYIEWISGFLSENSSFWNLLSPVHPKEYEVAEFLTFPMQAHFDYMEAVLKERREPVYLWVHFFEPHHPFRTPPEYSHRYGSDDVDLYDADLNYLDDQFGRFIEKLKREGLYDKYIIVLTADHGIDIKSDKDGKRKYEQNIQASGFKINIPLLIHLPGQTQEVKLDTLAEQVDIPPTLLELNNIEIPSWMQGESLVKYMKNPEKLSEKLKINLPLVYFDLIRMKNMGIQPEDAIVSIFWLKYRTGWKLSAREKQINIEPIFIYNWQDDPLEQKNLIDDSRYSYIIDKIRKSGILSRFEYI
jgi:arylsulfatase A-like enzyme